MNNITTGNFYFISDTFFDKVQDPYLKINYTETKRPHYFAFKDENTDLYWLVPCSSKTEKFEKIILKKLQHNRPADAIQIVKVFDKKIALLFQDMFPIAPKYIDSQYFKNKQAVRISDPVVLAALEEVAHRIVNLLRHGVRFTPTQPNVCRIERIMLNELEQTEEETVSKSVLTTVVETVVKTTVPASEDSEPNNSKTDDYDFGL